MMNFVHLSPAINSEQISVEKLKTCWIPLRARYLKISDQTVNAQFLNVTNTGCLMKNASTHNFFIYYPISMKKKIKDMVFQALQYSYKIYFFWRYLQ
jgi:hypothetical protein